MQAAEFTTELHGDADDTEWQAAAYDQFLKDDSAEDATYEALAKNSGQVNDYC